MPAAQLVEDYGQSSQKMTGTGSVAYSSHVSADSATVKSQLYYIHTDHLGTPQELTDRGSKLQWIGQYRAWGELAKANDSEGLIDNIEMPLRFQGQYFDAETGLHYNRFRYYDPPVGRFTTQDPISLAGGVNLYQYAPNPVQWIDPFGLSCGTPKEAERKINRDQGPKEIVRVDSPRPEVSGSQWHAHGKNGGAINQDGSLHDRDPEFSKKTLKWLREHGWNMDDWGYE